MPQLPTQALDIEEEIERVVDERLLIQADRSLYRSMVESCTERLKELRDYLADLERAAASLLLPPTPLVLST